MAREQFFKNDKCGLLVNRRLNVDLRVAFDHGRRKKDFIWVELRPRLHQVTLQARIFSQARTC
jgi:hypothetical protein